MTLLESTFLSQVYEELSRNFFDPVSLAKLCIVFGINFLVVWIITHFFYYPKSHRRDFYFTFVVLSSSIFMMIYLMDGSNMQIGAALGLFAVFGIIRYRTESVPIREMTYLFFIVSISVVNGTTSHISHLEHIVINLIFICVVFIAENFLLTNKWGCKYVQYDNIELITPDRREELIADLEKRLGLKVLRVEVGAVDFLRDMTMLRVYYADPNQKRIKSIDRMLKLRSEDAFS